jgi:hypothetical protein
MMAKSRRGFFYSSSTTTTTITSTSTSALFVVKTDENNMIEWDAEDDDAKTLKSAGFVWDVPSIRFAYEEWRIVMGKDREPIEKGKFWNFQYNYRQLLVLNLKAQQDARRAGKPLPPWKALNENGEITPTVFKKSSPLSPPTTTTARPTRSVVATSYDMFDYKVPRWKRDNVVGVVGPPTSNVTATSAAGAASTATASAASAAAAAATATTTTPKTTFSSSASLSSSTSSSSPLFKKNPVTAPAAPPATSFDDFEGKLMVLKIKPPKEMMTTTTTTTTNTTTSKTTTATTTPTATTATSPSSTTTTPTTRTTISLEEFEAALAIYQQSVTTSGGALDNRTVQQEAKLRASYVECRKAYLAWCAQYNKQEEALRFATFAANYLAMKEYARSSKSGGGRQLVLNEYADCTKEEYGRYRSQKKSSSSSSSISSANATLPSISSTSTKSSTESLVSTTNNNNDEQQSQPPKSSLSAVLPKEEKQKPQEPTQTEQLQQQLQMPSQSPPQQQQSPTQTGKPPQVLDVVVDSPPIEQQIQQQQQLLQQQLQGEVVEVVLDNTSTHIPTLMEWVQNPMNGSITGIIVNSTKYPDGTIIMTSAVPLGAQSDTVVVSSCGNPYRLGLPPSPPSTSPPQQQQQQQQSSSSTSVATVFDNTTTAPTLMDWEQNPTNGSITGIIGNSTKYPEGTKIATTAVPLGAQPDTIIVSSSGNRYRLLPPRTTTPAVLLDIQTSTTIATLIQWVQNPTNGSITGLVGNSTLYPDGTKIATTAVPLGAKPDTIVTSATGNRYRLLPLSTSSSPQQAQQQQQQQGGSLSQSLQPSSPNVWVNDGIPILTLWSQDPTTGTLRGMVKNKRSYNDGTMITTSAVPLGAQPGMVVTTRDGSMYLLL